MTDKQLLKAYVVSVTAMKKTDPPANVTVHHLPYLLPGFTIQDALIKAQEFALNNWKIVDGWYKHQAVAMPLTAQFFDLVSYIKEQGYTADHDNEDIKVLWFGPLKPMETPIVESINLDSVH